MYIDTHCHLEDERFKDIEQTVKSFKDNNVKYAINMGCEIKTSLLAKNLAEKFDQIYFAVGFHPEYADEFKSSDIETLENLANHPKCVAIGEIGLDYHYGDQNKEKQKECFVEQLKLANKLSLPICIHSRDATLDTITILKENKHLLSTGGVMHCFSGSVESANEYIKLGLKIGFGGTVTFKNAKNIVEVASKIPDGAILTETDSPYLSPEPKRGQLNAPENIPIILSKLAYIRGVSPSVMAEIVMKNARELFYKIKD